MTDKSDLNGTSHLNYTSHGGLETVVSRRQRDLILSLLSA